jgi:hypothetical protein
MSLVRQLPCHALALTTCTLDGRVVVVSGSDDKSVRLWDAAAGTQLKLLNGHTRPVKAVTTCTLDGRVVVVSGSSDNSVRLWDAAAGTQLKQLKGHTSAVFAVTTCTLDGRVVVVSGSFDKSVRLWDVDLPRTRTPDTAAPAMRMGADEVECTGEVTRAQRDANGRKRAIDLDAVHAKRQRTVPEELQTRLAKARSACSPTVDSRVRELMKPHYDAFVDGKMDGPTLETHRAAAREQAEGEHAPLAQLERTYAAYSGAMARRVAAEEEVEKAMAQEDAAEAALQAAMQALLPIEGGAGPSGVVKGELCH